MNSPKFWQLMSIKSIVRTCVVLLFLVFFNVSNAAEKLTVVFGGTLAPWVLSDTNEGIIIDLLKATLQPLGYEIEPLYIPYARRINIYKADDIDVVSDMNLNTIKQHSLKGFFPTAPILMKTLPLVCKKMNLILPN